MSVDVGGATMVTVGTGATNGVGTGGNGDGTDDGDSIELSPDPAVASDPVRIELNVKADTGWFLPVRTSRLKMEGWGLPSSHPGKLGS